GPSSPLGAGLSRVERAHVPKLADTAERGGQACHTTASRSGSAKGQRREQDAADNREDGSVRADAERERQNYDKRKTWRADKEPQREPQVCHIAPLDVYWRMK